MPSYRTRRRLSLVILLVGLPAYVVAAVTAVNWADRTFGRQPVWVELAIYVALGIVWALPFRAVFTGIGQPDPDGPPSQSKKERSGDRPS